MNRMELLWYQSFIICGPAIPRLAQVGVILFEPPAAFANSLARIVIWKGMQWRVSELERDGESEN